MIEHITGDSLANDVRMTRAQFSGSFLIVEGKTADFRFYRRFIDEQRCQIVPAHGKTNACDAITILEEDEFPGVLALVDADFWRLEGIDTPSSNVFLTDSHDLESMIVKSQALEKVLSEFGSSRKLERFLEKHGQEVRGSLLTAARQIGYLRWASERQGWLLKFEGISFGKFMDPDSMQTAIAELIKTVKNKSQRSNLPDEEVLEEIEGLFDLEHDLWDVCCGHDMVAILSMGLRNTWGSNNATNVSIAILEKALRLAYEAKFFCETQLHGSMKAWESKNRFRVFRSDLCSPED